jgi:hypothetical protein
MLPSVYVRYVVRCARDEVPRGLDRGQVDAFHLSLVRLFVEMGMKDVPDTWGSRALAMVSNVKEAVCDIDVPISKHHVPVPQPISSILFGLFSFRGAK